MNNQSFWRNRFTFTVVFLFLSSVFITSRSNDDGLQTHQGDVFIYDQTGLDDFARGQHQRVTGSMYISAPDITNLNGLESITVIEGSLIIKDNRHLTDISGLHNLTKVGEIYIVHPTITSLDAFSNVKEVNWTGSRAGEITGVPASITIQCPELLNLNGFSALRAATYIHLLECNQLNDLSGLEVLKSTNGIRISRCAKIENLAGLDSLEELGSLTLSHNAMLTSLAGMSSLEQLGEISIFNCPEFVNFEDLNPQITSLAKLEYSSEDTDFDDPLQGLEQITSIGEVYIEARLSNLNALENLTQVSSFKLSKVEASSLPMNLQSAKSIYLIGTGLTSLEGFENITGLTDLVLDRNMNLVSLSGLQNLESVNSLAVIYCPGLGDLSGFSNLKTIGIDVYTGGLRVESNGFT